jgi:hypothetical protein
LTFSLAVRHTDLRLLKKVALKKCILETAEEVSKEWRRIVADITFEHTNVVTSGVTRSSQHTQEFSGSFHYLFPRSLVAFPLRPVEHLEAGAGEKRRTVPQR